MKRPLLAFVIPLSLSLLLCGCQGSQGSTQATASPSVSQSASPEKSRQTHTFEVKVLNVPDQAIKVTFEGPNDITETFEPGKPSGKFELVEGIYDLRIQSVGFRNFALKLQIPENDNISVALQAL